MSVVLFNSFNNLFICSPKMANLSSIAEIWYMTVVVVRKLGRCIDTLVQTIRKRLALTQVIVSPCFYA